MKNVNIYAVEAVNCEGSHRGYPFIAPDDTIAKLAIRDVLRPLEVDSYYILYCVGSYDPNKQRIKPIHRLVYSSKESKK